jgi:hypothetical protein
MVYYGGSFLLLSRQKVRALLMEIGLGLANTNRIGPPLATPDRPEV